MQSQLYQKLVDKHRKEIMDAEEYIWHHPETGFREWKTDAYMQAVFEGAGYTLIKAGVLCLGAVDDDVIACHGARALFKAESGGRVCLRVKIAQKHPKPRLMERRRQIDRRGRLADAALLVDKRQNVSHAAPSLSFFQ